MPVSVSGRLVGREAELAVLRGVLTHRPPGTGAAVVLRGEAGVGKSRLVRQALEGAPLGSKVLVGRATEEAGSVPYRALHELAVAAVVSVGVDTAALGPLASPARLLAGLQADGPAESLSPIVAAEAVLALARGADATPPVLVVEDGQWADPDTAAAIEHMVARAGATGVVVIVTIRTGPGEPGASVAERLRLHPGVVDLGLVPLGREEIVELLGECLGQPPPSAFAWFVADRADGLPLLVEALVEGAVAASVLRRTGGRWQVDDSLSDVMPMTFASSVQRRLDRLGPDARLTVEAAALVGRYFGWGDVTAISGLDAGTTRAALRELADAGLIVADKNAAFAFRHALGRDAVLRQLLPSDRQDLARRGVAAIDATTNPALAGSLAELAGDRLAASMHLVSAARRALTVGALTAAEETLWRAWDLHASDEAADSLLETFTLQGRADEAIRLGRALGPRARHPAVALRLAKAALTAGDSVSAAAHLETLRTVPEGDRSAGVHLVAAELALQGGDFSDATAHAERAHEAAVRDGDAASVCEALELAGRAARPFDLAAAESAFERAYGTAVEHGLEPWRLRALQELGTIDLFSTQRVDRLAEARLAATATGAMRTLALVDLHLAGVRMGRWELGEALEAAEESITTSKRFHLPTHGMALVMGGTALALAGRHREAEEAARHAVAVAPDDLDVLAGVEGRMRALAAVVRGDLDGGLRHLDAAMAVARRSAAVALPVRGLWALLTTARAGDGAGHVAIAEVLSGPGLSSPLNRAMLETAQAVRDRAAAAVEPALAKPGAGLWFVAVARLVVADHAARSGWGEPARWAQEALAFFGDASGQERLASSARGVLRRAGVAVPRRGRGEAVVPRGLRAHGVTSREMDVLLLLAEGLTNAEIGERLHLSARTVEKHVSSLLAKTDTRRRAELVAYLGRAAPANGVEQPMPSRL